MKKIEFNDLRWMVEDQKSKLAEVFYRVADSSRFVLGAEVALFEKRFAEYVGSASCCGVSNGTDALELSIRALSLADGERVATVANAGFYATTAILCAGLKPYFMDVAPTTQVTTLREVEKAIESGVKAVIITHLFGRPVPETQSIASLCAQENIYLIEDCAQAHGGVIARQKVGSFGDLGCFSFYPTKNLGALGDAGCITVNRSNLVEIVREARQYGWGQKYQINTGLGRNSRLDELQAGFLNCMLPNLDLWNSRRQKIAQKYLDEINNPLLVVDSVNYSESVAHLFVVRSERRNELRSHLLENGIQTEIHYPIPDHMQAPIRRIRPDISLPITESLAEQVLSIPCHPGLSEKDADYTIKILNAFI